MTAINTSSYFNSVSDLTDTTKTSVRKVTSNSSGDTVVSEGDTSAFSSAESMGKSDFLNLLVTQLKYQDPMEPSADTEFVAQLAQFSQLENTQNMTTAMDTLTTNMNNFMTLQTLNSQSTTNASATPLLGKQVRVSEGSLTYEGNGETFDVHLKEGSSKGTLVIRDAKDVVVAEVAVSRADSKGGDVNITWNGKGTDGTALLAGKYTMEVVGTDGTTSAGYVFKDGKVTSVGFGETGATLTIDGTKYGLKNLVNVEEAES